MINNYVSAEIMNKWYCGYLVEILKKEKELDDVKRWLYRKVKNKEVSKEMFEDLFDLDGDFSEILKLINNTMVKANNLHNKYGKYIEEYKEYVKNKGEKKK